MHLYNNACGYNFYLFFATADNNDAEFVEEPHGEGYEKEGKCVGGGSDDGGDDEQNYDDVAAIAVHHLRTDKPHAAEYATQNGNFKDDAHREAQHQECFEIGGERHGVCHHRTHLVSAKKAKRKWEYQIVSKQQPCNEHCVSADYEAHGVLTLTSIERRRYEVEQQIDDVGRRCQ